MKDKCTLCEKKIMLADLSWEHKRALNHIERLNECLDIKEELNKSYRQEIDELRNKIRILENDK